MCLLCFVPPKKWPKKKHLKNACVANPDGFGFAINTGSEIITRKSMYADELIEEFFDLRNDNKNCAALFHSRLATHGSKTIDNCHPFNVSSDERIVMAHNGILPVIMGKNESRSDTKVFADEYMTKLGVESLDDPIGFDIIKEYCTGSKLVFLNTSDRLKYQWYIVNEERGMYEKDIWYSNGSYKDYVPLTAIPNKYYDHGYSNSFYNNIIGTKNNKEEYYEDDDVCLVCYQNYDSLDDEKYLTGCSDCGLSSEQLCSIYSEIVSYDYNEDYESIHSKPLSLDWNKPLV